jgi:hypothetical protein
MPGTDGGPAACRSLRALAGMNVRGTRFASTVGTVPNSCYPEVIHVTGAVCVAVAGPPRGLS